MHNQVNKLAHKAEFQSPVDTTKTCADRRLQDTARPHQVHASTHIYAHKRLCADRRLQDTARPHQVRVHTKTHTFPLHRYLSLAHTHTHIPHGTTSCESVRAHNCTNQKKESKTRMRLILITCNPPYRRIAVGRVINERRLMLMTGTLYTHDTHTHTMNT